MVVPPGGELLESRPSRTGRWWATLPPVGRRLVAVLVVLVVVVGAGLWLRDRAAERQLRQRVVLAASVAVVSSSTSPPGGSVHWFLTVHNEGARPVSVLSVDGGTDRLRLHAADGTDTRIDPGRAADVPVSVRLTCGAGGGALGAVVGVRREDGGTARRGVDVGAASLVEDVADTLCAVRPALRDHELSGPVLNP